MNNPSRYTDPSGHTPVCEDNDCKHNYPTNSGGNKDKEETCKGLECIHSHDEDNDITLPIGIPVDPPNPSLYALVPLAILFTVTTGIVEVGVVLGEAAMAPVDTAMPIIGIPLSLTLAAAGAAVLDLDIALIVYTARVAENPEVHQDFEILPLWGLSK